jgi:hypothetical protein
MSRKYAMLTTHLEQQIVDEISLSFTSIEKIVGFSLPRSAREHGVWWSNSRSSGRHNEAWLNIGWEAVALDLKAQTMAFRRSGERGPNQRPPRAVSRRRALNSAFDASMLTDTDLAADCAVRLQLHWRRLGEVMLDRDQKLVFPDAPVTAGLYRLIVGIGNRTMVYVGEAVNLKRRFGNYRLPGKTQQTSLRINALLVEALSADGKIAVDIAYQNIGLSVDGTPIEADLSNKAVRRMIEHAAIVAHGGIDVEMMNR